MVQWVVVRWVVVVIVSGHVIDTVIVIVHVNLIDTVIVGDPPA